MKAPEELSSALEAIWERRRPTILGGVSKLEAILAAGAGGLDEAARGEAEREAHKLAGSLGTFGFAEGSESARRLELMLASARPLDPEPLPGLCDLVAALRQSLPSTPATSPPAGAVDEVDDGTVHTVRGASARATTVLAVDDDPNILAALRAILADAGNRLVTLEDPLRFWDVLEETRPDLVLLDLDMPEVSGLQLCRLVRQDSRWSTLPVMFLTASAGPQAVRAIFAAGADDYVAKPIVGPELSARIANRMERVSLYRAMADTDPLTGLANRRKSQEVLDSLARLAARYHQPLSLAVIDLDRFKQVNDRHGHAAGDVVLRRLGEVLKHAFRGEDVAARWGGEEFVVGMYGMTKHDAVKRLGEVLAQFRGERFAGKDREFGVTFSAGVAELGVDGDLDAAYRAADEVLYSVKACGRDRVVAAGWRAAGVSRTPDVAVVEDDEVTGRLLQTALEGQGYTTTWIQDGAVAATVLAALRPRVVLLDVQLPGMNGMEILQRLSDDGALAETRVIVVTGGDDDDQAVAAFELGACDHVVKPFKMAVLLERVHRTFVA